jgi:hypothetical protein
MTAVRELSVGSDLSDAQAVRRLAQDDPRFFQPPVADVSGRRLFRPGFSVPPPPAQTSAVCLDHDVAARRLERLGILVAFSQDLQELVAGVRHHAGLFQ